MDPTLQEPGEERPGQATAGENGGPLPELFALVPASEDILDADEGGGFGDGLEEADDHDLGGGMDEGGAEGEEAPDDHHGGEEDAGRDSLEGEVGGDLAEDVAAVEY